MSIDADFVYFRFEITLNLFGKSQLKLKDIADVTLKKFKIFFRNIRKQYHQRKASIQNNKISNYDY